MMRFAALLLSALAGSLLCACERKSKGPAAAPVPVVEVITDPAHVEQARAAYRRKREQIVNDALAEPGTIRAYDTYLIALLRDNRDRVVAELTRLRDDAAAPPAERVDAILALHALGVPFSPPQLAEVAGASSDGRFALLLSFHELYELTGDTPPALPAEMRQFLRAALDDAQGNVRVEAAEKAALYGVDD